MMNNYNNKRNGYNNNQRNDYNGCNSEEGLKYAKDINKKLDDNSYVEIAETAIEHLSKKKYKGKTVDMVTTSKIRNLLSMAADIYNSVMYCGVDKLPDELNGKIEYLRVRFIYEASREPAVKNLLDYADLINILKNIGGSKKRYLLFYHYMEALVAFKKYKNSLLGKKDD
mgnify:FL=1